MRIFILCFFLCAGFAQAQESFSFIPDTATIKTKWPEFFKDPVYLSLSTTTRKNVTDKLFADLIASDTNYQAWNYGLQNEAKKIFYERAGFEMPEKITPSHLSAERIMSYDKSESVEEQAVKEKRLGAALVQSSEAKLPSPPVEPDNSAPKTEIPHADVKKLTMPVGRSWFSSPLEDLQNDPAFMGYVVLMKSNKYR